MAREVKTAEEIRDIMQGWLDSSDVLNGQCRGCAAPSPRRLPMADVSGCNWTAIAFPNLLTGCAEVVQEVLRRARRGFELPPKFE
jgi:hypothetical protein